MFAPHLFMVSEILILLETVSCLMQQVEGKAHRRKGHEFPEGE
jgi:hypothetical protein